MIDKESGMTKFNNSGINASTFDLINFPFLNEIDPLLQNIRSESSFKQLMQKAKDKWENFEV